MAFHRLAIDRGREADSACDPSMVLLNRQPPMGSRPCGVAGPSCLCRPSRQAWLWPDGQMAPAITHWPYW